MVLNPQQSQDFSAAVRRQSGVARISNTGQKYLTAPILDFCTVVLPEKALKVAECGNYHELIDWLFGAHNEIVLGPITERTWNFYPLSATLIDSTSSICGKLGIKEDGSVCISLSGQGTQHVNNWRITHNRLMQLGARITRLDIAIDDLAGSAFNVQKFLEWQKEGMFTTNGRPPLARYVDDLGSNKGCTLYIGQKGYKELCIYEKGKQLGDPDSDHTRVELRLYSKHHIIPLDALIHPEKYFASAYSVLEQFVQGQIAQLIYKEHVVQANANAMVKNLRNQTGTAINLLYKAFGDETMNFIIEKICRDGRPGRFKKTHGDLVNLVKTTLTDKLGESHH